MKYKKLGDICNIKSGGTPSRRKKEYWDSGTIPWVKIGDIKGKYISNTSEFITEQGLNESSAKLFKKGTLLYTIFATLGEVAILDIDATTNQAIVGISHTNEVDTNYLYYFLKSKKEYVNDIGRGVAQNNINLSMLKDIDVYLPSNLEQQKISKVLDKAQELIDKRKEQIEALDELVKSQFIEMFGDPVTNSKGWKKKKLNELGELSRGKSKHRPRNAPELLGGPYPLVQTGDIANAGIYLKEYTQTYSELGLKQSKMWDKGTLCITIAANIAKTSILTFDACFPDSVVAFIPNDKTNNMFIQFWMSFLQKILEDSAPESAQKNINLKILSEQNVIVPPIELQNQFADFVNQVDKLKFEMEKSLKELEDNFNALMQKAFDGELFN